MNETCLKGNKTLFKNIKGLGEDYSCMERPSRNQASALGQIHLIHEKQQSLHLSQENIIKGQSMQVDTMWHYLPVKVLASMALSDETGTPT